MVFHWHIETTKCTGILHKGIMQIQYTLYAFREGGENNEWDIPFNVPYRIFTDYIQYTETLEEKLNYIRSILNKPNQGALLNRFNPVGKMISRFILMWEKDTTYIEDKHLLCDIIS